MMQGMTRSLVSIALAVGLIAGAGACATGGSKVPAGTAQPDNWLFERGTEALNKKIKKADHVAAYLEATQLAGFSLEEAGKFFGKPSGLDGARGFHALRPLAPNDAEAAYVRKFKQLL